MRIQSIIVIEDREIPPERLAEIVQGRSSEPIALPAPEEKPVIEGEILPNRFAICVAHIFSEEGGYSDHTLDPGGATNMGITHKALAEWRGVESVSKTAVRNLTKAEAGEIYYHRYWLPAECDTLPAGIDLMVFNICVNAGVHRGQVLLQETLARMGLYKHKIDGDIGRKTAEALALANTREFITLYAERILAYYKSLASLFKTFGDGWKARLKRTHDKAQKMAIAAPQPSLMPLVTSAPMPRDRHGDEGEEIAEVKGMTLIDVLLGGGSLVGKKTIIGIVGYVGLVVAWNLGLAPDFLTPSMYEVLYTLLGGLAGLGFVSKVERYAQEFGFKSKPISSAPKQEVNTEFDPFKPS